MLLRLASHHTLFPIDKLPAVPSPIETTEHTSGGNGNFVGGVTSPPPGGVTGGVTSPPPGGVTGGVTSPPPPGGTITGEPVFNT